MIKENTVLHLKIRVLSEYKKHPTLDWAEIAARKLYSGIIKDLQRTAFEAGRKLIGSALPNTYEYDTFEDYLKELE